MAQIERMVARQVASYLQTWFPGVLYRFDLAADMPLSRGQAARHKLMHPERGWPDLTIMAARGGYHGLVIELKADAETLYRQDGQIRVNPHFQEQEVMLARFKREGYAAEWGLGFDDTVSKISHYLHQTKTRD